MNKNKALARLALIEQSILDLPDSLQPSSVDIQKFCNDDVPEVIVTEHWYNEPDAFFTYADSIGKTVERVKGYSDNYDALQFFTDTGVRIKELTAKLTEGEV